MNLPLTNGKTVKIKVRPFQNHPLRWRTDEELLRRREERKRNRANRKMREQGQAPLPRPPHTRHDKPILAIEIPWTFVFDLKLSPEMNLLRFSQNLWKYPDHPRYKALIDQRLQEFTRYFRHALTCT